MKERYEVTFPNGDTYSIGAMPIISIERLRKLEPDLAASLEKGADGHDNLEEQIYQIVKFYNPATPIDREGFYIDSYSGQRVYEIWNGDIDEEEEKKKANLRN